MKIVATEIKMCILIVIRRDLNNEILSEQPQLVHAHARHLEILHLQRHLPTYVHLARQNITSRDLNAFTNPVTPTISAIVK